MSQSVGPLAAVWLSVLLLCGGAAHARGGVYSQSPHGNPKTGVLRTTGPNILSSTARGACVHCHLQHSSLRGKPLQRRQHALFTANDNSLCTTCHVSNSLNGTYQGTALYTKSGHGNYSDPNTQWPGTLSGGPHARLGNEAGKCLNCHDPHGWADNNGLVPSLLVGRDEKVCFACHDGSRTHKNVRIDFVSKTYAHPMVATSGRHTSLEGRMDSDQYRAMFGGRNRHVECVDCHNPHVVNNSASRDLAGGTRFGPTNLASSLIKGVSYLEVINNAPGVAPTYIVRPASYTTPVTYEYQLCIKCHSAWGWNGSRPTTTTPNGLPGTYSSDPSIDFNPANYSHHGVEAAGNNYGKGMRGAPIFPNGSPFASPVTATSTVWCSDCHGSDTYNATNAPNAMSVKGPHGSNQRYILRKFYNSARGTWSTVFCYNCHDSTVYGYSDGVTDTSWIAPTHANRSRVNHPINDSHRLVSNQRNYSQIWCLDCHGGYSNSNITGPLGGIHGSNDPPGPGGGLPLGQNMMNGAVVQSWNVTAGQLVVSTVPRGSRANYSACSQVHSPSRAFPLNW